VRLMLLNCSLSEGWQHVFSSWHLVSTIMCSLRCQLENRVSFPSKLCRTAKTAYVYQLEILSELRMMPQRHILVVTPLTLTNRAPGPVSSHAHVTHAAAGLSQDLCKTG
jgi:hypothetical protein